MWFLYYNKCINYVKNDACTSNGGNIMNRNIIKKLFVLCLAIAMCFSMTFATAYAMETTVSENDEVTNETVRSTNSFTYYNGGSPTVYLQKMTANQSHKSYTGVCSSSGVVNLRFTHSSGSSYVLTFVVNNNYQYDLLGVSLPAGYYTVTQEYSSATYSYIMISFTQ